MKGFIIGVLGVGFIVGILLVVPLFFNSGTSTDFAYSIENTKVGWYKLWLKDDHTNVYCFDNNNFLPIIKEAQEKNKKVAVSYQDYWIRGSLCSSGNEKIGSTVVTDIKIIE